MCEQGGTAGGGGVSCGVSGWAGGLRKGWGSREEGGDRRVEGGMTNDRGRFKLTG